MNICLICAAISVFTLSTAHAATVSCSVGERNDRATIDFGEISEGLRNEDFAEMGQFGITAVVTGNGKTAKFSQTFKYKKVGGRIEFNEDALIYIREIRIEQFQSEFGLFPEANCSTP